MTRPRKPQAVHLAQGTYRKDRHGPVSERDFQGRPDRPQDLQPEAAAFWDDVCSELIDTGIAKHIDGPALRLMANLWGKLQAASRLADADATDTNARRSMTSYAAEFCKLAGRFGLTPSDRQRLQVGPDPEARQAEIERQYFGGS